MDAYIRAAIVLDKLDARSGSVKGLAAAHAKHGDTKRLIALVSETLKCRSGCSSSKRSKLVTVEALDIWHSAILTDPGFL
jgi:hypothetical protein